MARAWSTRSATSVHAEPAAGSVSKSAHSQPTDARNSHTKTTRDEPGSERRLFHTAKPHTLDHLSLVRVYRTRSFWK